MELQDILLFNDQLSEEELIIHRSAREYCQQELLSRIVDANFAEETSNLTKNQILNQAATSMLAQANASKQNLLALLQG